MHFQIYKYFKDLKDLKSKFNYFIKINYEAIIRMSVNFFF